MTENPIANEISEYIKEQIMSERYHEHDKISERIFCDQFNVSRTIVREAMVVLKKEGWVYSENKSGTYVAPLDLEQIYENYTARMVLEPSVLMMAAPNLRQEDYDEMRANCEKMRTAATKADYSMAENRQHRILCDRANNRYVASFINSMMEYMCRIGSKAGHTQERRQACVQEWLDIIAELERGNQLEARTLFSMHIRASFSAFRKNYVDIKIIDGSKKEVNEE